MDPGRGEEATISGTGASAVDAFPAMAMDVYLVISRGGGETEKTTRSVIASTTIDAT